jgi:hypothetical protein
MWPRGERPEPIVFTNRWVAPDGQSPEPSQLADPLELIAPA